MAGRENANAALDAIVGGGEGNRVAGGSITAVKAAFIGAGDANTVSATAAGIVSGSKNSAAGPNSFVGAGNHNMAGGANATVPGGSGNQATGINSFAAGRNAQATKNGAFVWGDNSGSAVTASRANQFVARASGGFALYSSRDLSTGVQLAPGSGSWSSVSDRTVKTGVAEVDDAAMLAKIVALPVTEWSYRAEGTAVRHVGPMAQDFRAAFGLGEDDRHIATVDEGGVALAAIKGLKAENDALRASLRREHARIDVLQRQFARLQSEIERVR